MLPDRTQRLQQLGQTDKQWDDRGRLAPGDFKAGHGVDAFVHVGRDQANLRTRGAGLILDARKTVLRPGAAFSLPVDFTRMTFEAHSFNPLATKASSAVNPIPTFIPASPGLDPDLRVVAGMINTLETLRRLVS